MKTEITFHDFVSSFNYLKQNSVLNYDFSLLEREIKKLEIEIQKGDNNGV